MGGSPEISVVVPVYNVADYLTRCVDSLLRQSFSEYEIMLIDDGSTDGSGELCEQIAGRDPRIRVLHKRNGGLSDARNYGIERLRGKYVTFVDSDDWLETAFLEYLYRAIRTTGADISTCVYMRRCGDSSKPWKNLPEDPEVIEGREALLSLLYDEKINVSANGKLYSSHLFKDIRYPLGKRYEDVGTTYRLMAEARSVAVGGAPLYNYLMRPGSITHAGTVGLMDRYELAKEAYENLIGIDADIDAAAERYLTFHILSVLRSYDAGDSYQTERAKELRKEALSHKKAVLANPRAQIRDKAALYALSLGIRFYRIAWRVYCAATDRN
ncbi:glycosyltransferase family 2 protein [Collinsella intestinalis]|uniref:glycosyltransferase family 2 protein n=1 Tax=Collinsella intestinalis TaxID=147207 RepID=UPI001959B480|nr:glycosyltransferase family 2 protein [Collinsella intestinalis]MBM6683714.1 glycosyltransferase family 2 protein [Collinsella intestinalis]